MKKTLVAVAAMAAVTGAMADATIYGVIDQAYSSSKSTTGSTVTNQKTNIGAYQMGQTLVGVKGSEDIGGGLKASYLYEFGLSTDTSATPTNRQSYVGLSGGFGSIRVGKQYSQGFNNTVGADPLGATGGAGALYLAPLTGYDGSEHPLRQDKGFQYDLPTFVPGVGITLTKVFGAVNSAATNSTSGTETNSIKTGDGTGVALTYTNGPLYAGFTTDSVNNTGVAAGTTDATTPVAATIIAASSTAKNKLNTSTLTYDLGAAKVSYSNAKMSVGAQNLQTTMYGISVPMGAATLVASSSSGKYDITGTDGKLKGMQYGVNYALSKRTTAYWHNGNSTQTPDTGDQVKVKGFGVGLMHAF